MRTYVNHKDLTAVLVLNYLLEVKEARTTKEIVHDLLEGGPFISKATPWVYVRRLLGKLDDEALLVRNGQFWKHEDTAPSDREKLNKAAKKAERRREELLEEMELRGGGGIGDVKQLRGQLHQLRINAGVA